MDTNFLTLFVLACSLSIASADLQDGLVSYWTFDTIDLADPVVRDVQGGNDGTFVGSPDPGVGIIGEGLIFDGSADAVEIPHPVDDSLDFGADTDFTISAWIKTSATNETTILSKNDGGTNARILFKVDNAGRLFITISEPNVGQVDLRSVTLVNDDEWRHVVLIADRSDGTFVYVDGEVDAEGGASEGINVSSTSDLRIGSSIRVGGATRRFFNGSIDDVAIWDCALTADDIAELYANGLAGQGATGGTFIPFAITSVEPRGGDAPEVTVVWNSRSGAQYAVDRSTDLKIWRELDDGVNSGGDETSYTDADGVVAFTTLYYRVREL